MRTPQLADNLRRALLQAAVEGRLTERSSEDGSAQDLLDQIQAEKAARVKAGSLKKAKPLPAIGDDEKPFEIPENWVWVRLGEIVINRDAERIPLSKADREKREKIFDYYGASGVIDKVDNYLFDEPLLLVGEDGANLITRSEPIAFIATGKYWVNNHAHVLQPLINTEYLMYYINAIDLYPYVTGTAQPKMNQEKMNAILVSVPPLAEQSRIVAKLDALLAETDALKTQETALQAEQNAFPKKLRAALLQAAVQGELNERTDEDARDLLAAIQTEKTALQKNGKLKKDKPLAAINEEEIPFAIPENWVWVRLGEIGDIQTGTTPSKSEKDNYGEDFPFFKPADLAQGKNITQPSEFLSIKGKSKARIARRDSLLINGIGNIGKLGVVRMDGAFNQQMHSFTPYKNIELELVYFFLQSPCLREAMFLESSQTTVPILNKNNFSAIYFPFPPLTEQQQIVAKLEALLAEIDTLENAT